MGEKKKNHLYDQKKAFVFKSCFDFFFPARGTQVNLGNPDTPDPDGPLMETSTQLQVAQIPSFCSLPVSDVQEPTVKFSEGFCAKHCVSTGNWRVFNNLQRIGSRLSSKTSQHAGRGSRACLAAVESEWHVQTETSSLQIPAISAQTYGISAELKIKWLCHKSGIALSFGTGNKYH